MKRPRKKKWTFSQKRMKEQEATVWTSPGLSIKTGLE